MPWLNLLADDRLDPSVVFAPVLDERFDGSIEIVGHFTTVGNTISLPVHVPREGIGIT